jgi:hypothetical protein
MTQQLPALSFETDSITEKKCTKKTSEREISEAIEEILSLLGNTNKQAIYHYLEDKYAIKKEDIPNNMAKFANAFEQTFGSVAKLIEVKIIERLHARHRDFFYVPSNGDIDFLEFIANFQQYIEG